MAKNSHNAEVAACCSKSAAVLIAAALERYVNAALEHRCRKIRATDWTDLPIGMQRYLCLQISRRLKSVAVEVKSTENMTEKKEMRLRRAVRKANSAFEDPSTWSDFTEFGLFMEGAAAPDRLNSLLRDFHPTGKTLFEVLEERGQDRDYLGRSLTDLIDTRHAVAHAIPDRSMPSPNDVATWLVVAFTIARGIEVYLASFVSE